MPVIRGSVVHTYLESPSLLDWEVRSGSALGVGGGARVVQGIFLLPCIMLLFCSCCIVLFQTIRRYVQGSGTARVILKIVPHISDSQLAVPCSKQICAGQLAGPLLPHTLQVYFILTLQSQFAHRFQCQKSPLKNNYACACIPFLVIVLGISRPYSCYISCHCALCRNQQQL